MTFIQLLFTNLVFYRRTNLAVVLGVAAATAVLTGALIVGDSVRFSLRKLALDRLGRIDELLVSDHFFREELAAELRANAEIGNAWWRIEPALLFPAATIEHRHEAATAGSSQVRRASSVLALGIRDSFWDLSDPKVRPGKNLARDEIVLNEPLANELGVKVGDVVTLRFSKLAQVPADSPLGRKTGRVQSLPEMKVVAILPAKSLGQFSLHPQQGTSHVAFVPLPDMQDALEQNGKVNAMFAAGHDQDSPPGDLLLKTSLAPQLVDYGLKVEHVRNVFSEAQPPDVVFDYWQLTSDRMMLAPEVEQAALEAWKDRQPQRIYTYLANTIAVIPAIKVEDGILKKNEGIPYSTVAAVEQLPVALSDSENETNQLKPGEIALTSWAADDLQAKIGDRVRLDFFEPESTHGTEVQTSAEFTLAAIVPLTAPTQPYTRRQPAVFADRPTPANDPDFTPQVAGITDQASIADWDAPFPFDQSRIRTQDDEFWEYYRTTPKAYISFADGERLWGSRFGQTTSIRVPAAEGERGEQLGPLLLNALRPRKSALGFDFQPVKQQAIKASSGTTPFDFLFLCLSMFVIGAALLLVWLLFRLGVEQRVAEQGLLRALGWSLPRTTRLHTGEGMVLAMIGAVLGAALGVAYAWIMITGLRTWWVGAVTSPFLELRITSFSLIVGSILGLLTAAFTVWLGMRSMRQMAIRDLLAGKISTARPSAISAQQSWWRYLPPALLVLALGLLIGGFFLKGESQGGAALVSGGALLAAIMLKLRDRLAGSGAISAPQPLKSLGELAIRNAGRNPTRSMATMSLMGAAVFMIVAVSAFRLTPTDAGTGGFPYLAESAEPIVPDLNTIAGRVTLLGDGAEQLGKTEIFPFRLQPGDDASCRNLYQAQQPRVLGVTREFVDHFDHAPQFAFRWAGSAASNATEKQNPWHVLHPEDAPARMPNDAIPVVIDKNTAMYSLKLYFGIGEEFTVDYDRGPIRFRVVGLLAESVLQGNLLVSEADFKQLFPDQSGYRFFLIRPDNEAVVDLLEDRLGDEGFDVVDARQRLIDLFAVQNTYISTFQTLGGLGLLLGTFGLAAVQLRNVLERRGELALLRSVGFGQQRLLSLVLEENAFLLAGGILTGVFAATFALLPQLLTGGATPPWLDLATTIGLVTFVGGVVSWWAARTIQKAPVIAALRGE